MRVFIKSIFVQIFLNFYVFWRGWKLLPNKKWLRVPFAAVFALEIIAYFVELVFKNDLPLPISHFLAWICTTWMVFLGYMSALLLVYDGLRLLSKKINWLARVNWEALRLKRIYYLSSSLFVFGLMLYGNYEFKNPTVTQLDIVVKKDAVNREELKIAVVSDIHAGIIIDKKILSGYIDQIMAQKADLILLVGDIIDYDIASVKAQNMQEEFRKLKAPCGVYVVAGNHEYIDVDEEKEAKINWLRTESGMTLLRDSVVFIDDSFYLVGRDDYKNKARNSLSALMSGVDKKYPVIVMNHQPHHLYDEVNNEVDLALYGHTHNGQLFPANILVGMMYEVGYGYKRVNNTHLYVTSGLGLAGPQYRIGTISEIVIVNVKLNKR